MLKYRSNIITIVSIVLIAVAIVNIYFTVEVRVTSNDECLWVPKKVSKDSVAVFFDLVKINGVTWNAGIRNGDQLLEIDGNTIYSTIQAQRILNHFTIGEHAKYKFMKDGEIFTSKVYIKKLVQFGALAASLTALFWMIISFIVLVSKPDGRIHKIFYTLGVLTVFSSLHILLPIYGVSDDFMSKNILIGAVIGGLWLIGVCFTPFVLNYFFWNFPGRFKFAEKKIVKYLVFIIPFLMAAAAFVYVVVLFNTPVDILTFSYKFESFINFLIVGDVTAFVALLIQYRRIKSKVQRKPILWFIIAFIFGMTVSIYTRQIAPAISDTLFNSPEYYTPIILIVFVPLIFAYSIFKYQLMDVSIVIKNTIIYGTATVIVAAIYFFVIYVAGQSISSFFGVENQGIIAGIFFIIFALVFQSTKNRFQDFLTKRF